MRHQTDRYDWSERLPNPDSPRHGLFDPSRGLSRGVTGYRSLDSQCMHFDALMLHITQMLLALIITIPFVISFAVLRVFSLPVTLVGAVGLFIVVVIALRAYYRYWARPLIEVQIYSSYARVLLKILHFGRRFEGVFIAVVPLPHRVSVDYDFRSEIERNGTGAAEKWALRYWEAIR